MRRASTKREHLFSWFSQGEKRGSFNNTKKNKKLTLILLLKRNYAAMPCHQATRQIAGFARAEASSPLELGVQSETPAVLSRGRAPSHNACFLVLPHPLLEEICLALQADEVHPIEWVLRLVHLDKNR